MDGKILQERVETLGGQGWIELKSMMGDETTIVDSARISYNGNCTEMGDKDVALLESLIANKHTTPLEHVVATFRVYAPIFVVRQWFRHRTWSYSELSRRYSGDAIEFYVPDVFNSSREIDEGMARLAFREAHGASLAYYNELLNLGVKKEQARGVLPVDMMTEFVATVDLNNLIKFVELRESSHAQREIREYAEAIKKLVSGKLPNVARKLGWT